MFGCCAADHHDRDDVEYDVEAEQTGGNDMRTPTQTEIAQVFDVGKRGEIQNSEQETANPTTKVNPVEAATDVPEVQTTQPEPTGSPSATPSDLEMGESSKHEAQETKAPVALPVEHPADAEPATEELSTRQVRAAPQAQQLSAVALALISDSFALHDLDHSGFVDIDENVTMDKSMAEAFGTPFDEAKSRACFKEFDINHDGQISLAEYVDGLVKLMPEAAEEELVMMLRTANEAMMQRKTTQEVLELIGDSFQLQDRDHSGFIELGESVQMDKAVAEAFGRPFDEAASVQGFNEFDINHDGKITLAEYTEGMARLLPGVTPKERLLMLRGAKEAMTAATPYLTEPSFVQIMQSDTSDKVLAKHPELLSEEVVYEDDKGSKEGKQAVLAHVTSAPPLPWSSFQRRKLGCWSRTGLNEFSCVQDVYNNGDLIERITVYPATQSKAISFPVPASWEPGMDVHLQIGGHSGATLLLPVKLGLDLQPGQRVTVKVDV